jgi:hypothetical protein
MMSGICASAQVAGALGQPPSGVILLPTTFLQNSLHIAMDARGPAIDVFNYGGGRYRTCRQHPLGAHCRCLQLWWWPLPDLPLAPPRGPPLTSSTLVVAAAGPAASTQRAPAVDVFNFSGGRCRTYRQHP